MNTLLYSRSSVSCRTRYEDLNDVDICSPKFNYHRAAELMKGEGERQVCDVLLDQSILPGVGNIIKNEALFDSGIKPSSKVHIQYFLYLFWIFILNIGKGEGSYGEGGCTHISTVPPILFCLACMKLYNRQNTFPGVFFQNIDTKISEFVQF